MNILSSYSRKKENKIIASKRCVMYFLTGVTFEAFYLVNADQKHFYPCNERIDSQGLFE